MNMSFYTAARAAMSQQDKMNIISNNIANVNTTAYKTKNTVFSDLMYYNMREVETADTHLTAGTGVKVSHTNTDFSEAGITPTGDSNDFAVLGEGFFMLRDNNTEEISYTRDGQFYLASFEEGYYLMTNSQKHVLDAEGEMIYILPPEDTDEDDVTAAMGELSALPGIYTFVNTDGMMSVGSNEYVPLEKNGEPTLNISARAAQGFLEMSNVNIAKELADTVLSSASYAYMLKMMQKTDEVVNTINNLR